MRDKLVMKNLSGLLLVLISIYGQQMFEQLHYFVVNCSNEIFGSICVLAIGLAYIIGLISNS